MPRLIAIGALAAACLACSVALAQDLGGAAEAFPRAPAAGTGGGGVTVRDVLNAAGLPEAQLVRGSDGSTTLQGVPLSSDFAQRIDRALGRALPAPPVLGQGPTTLVDRLLGRSGGIPGVIVGPGGSAAVEGTSNLVTSPPDAVVPWIPSAPSR